MRVVECRLAAAMLALKLGETPENVGGGGSNNRNLELVVRGFLSYGDAVHILGTYLS